MLWNTGPQWEATVKYRTDEGSVDVVHYLSELHELDPLVDGGPHYDTIENITIVRLGHIESPTLTVEQASRMV